MSILNTLIKEKAVELGFHKVGIARADSIEKDKQNLEEWIKRKHHATMDWVEKRKDERGDVFKYFPEVKTIISRAGENTKIVFATIIELKNKNISKQELERIILIEVPSSIYSEIRTIFLFLFEASGFKEIKINENINFEELFNKRLNQ